MIPETLDSLAVPINDLTPYEQNPRQGDISLIAESLERNGQYRPIVVNKRGNVILAGNHTFWAAKELGWSSIAATFVDADEETARRIVLIDNRANDLASYDDEALAGMIQAIVDAEGPEGLIGTGFDTDDLDGILAELESEGEPVPDPEPATPALPDKAVTKPGDLWQLGDHRLLCGDSTDKEQVERLIGDHDRAALLFTSPPYLDAREYGGGKNLEVSDLARFIETFEPHVRLMAVNLGLIRRDGALVTYWDAYIEQAASAGLKLISWNIWDRGMPWSVAQQTAMFPLEHEWIFIFGQEPFDLNLTVPNKTAGEDRKNISNRQPDGSIEYRATKEIRSHRALGTLIRMAPANGQTTGHPAVFPIGLPAAYIEAASDPGDLILEPFGGSGTTLIAAHDAGRTCFTMELDPAYCDVICRRFQETTGIVPVREADGKPRDFTA